MKYYLLMSLRKNFKKINNKISDAMLHLMTSLDELPLVKEIYPEGTPVHDLLVSVFLVDPSIFTHKMVNVEVEVDSELTLGQTVVDSLGISDRKTNVNWIYDLDSGNRYKRTGWGFWSFRSPRASFFADSLL